MVTPNVKGGRFLPPAPQYMDHASKRMEAAALLAGLKWVQSLLLQFPNHTNPDPPPLPIPVDNNSMVKDVHRTINAQTPTFDLLSPDYDIMQAVCMTLAVLSISMDIYHMKGHQD